MTDQKAHSPIGASSMHRWAECPGSVRLAKALPPAPSSAYAEEGTRAHALAETILRGGAILAEGLPEGMAEAVQVYVDAVRADIAEGYEAHIEVSFNLGAIHPGLYGTADAVLWHAGLKRLKVYDYKHGAGLPVNVNGNPQLRYYALGALLTTGFKAEQVEIVVVQPRCPHADGPVRRETIDALDLLDFAADLKEYAVKTEDPNAPLVPGDHCRFCPAAGVCPAKRDKAQALAKLAFSEVQPAYDPKQLAEALTWAGRMEAWAASVREFAYNEAMRGRAPPGFKLVEKVARRKWRNEDEARQFLEVYGMDEKDILEPQSIRSPAQIEKALGKKVFAADVEPYTIKESSGYTLAPESDRRPAIAMDAKSAFTAIEHTTEG